MKLWHFSALLLFGLDCKATTRQPRIGRTLSEVSLEDLEPRARFLKVDEIKFAEANIVKQIEAISSRLSQDDKDALLTDAEQDVPFGYECENQILEVTEVSFTDQVRCYNTSEEVCSMVNSILLRLREAEG